MHLDPDYVPPSIHKAVQYLVNSFTPGERQELQRFPGGEIHHSVCSRLISAWSLGHSVSLLRVEAAKYYKLGHPMDVAGLIITWAAAIVRKQPFDPGEYAAWCEGAWQSLGTNSISAGHAVSNNTSTWESELGL